MTYILALVPLVIALALLAGGVLVWRRRRREPPIFWPDKEHELEEIEKYANKEKRDGHE